MNNTNTPCFPAEIAAALRRELETCERMVGANHIKGNYRKADEWACAAQRVRMLYEKALVDEWPLSAETRGVPKL